MAQISARRVAILALSLYVYRAEVLRVIDGDTFVARVDLGFHVSLVEHFRLDGIDTPEIFRPRSPEEAARGKEAKRRVRELIEGKKVLIRTKKTGKYGRWIARVILPDGRDLTKVLLEEGFAKEAVYAKEKVPSQKEVE